MNKKYFFDNLTLLAIFLLIGTGIVMVYSSSSIFALNNFDDTYFFLKKQIFFATFGIVLMIFLMNIKYQIFAKLVYPILILSIVLLILVLVPGLGKTVNGSMRWLRIGGFSFQPSEAAKLGLIIYLAYSLAKKRERVQDFASGFLPHFIITSIMAFLVLKEPDLGGAVMLATLFFLLLFSAKARFSHLFPAAILYLSAVFFLIINVSYRFKRLTAFLNPWNDPTDTGYHIIHSYLAFGSGGFWGTGLGNGKMKLFYLPEPYTDFILSVIGEELGLIGVMTILFLFLFLVLRGITISLRAPDLFGTYLALGITLLIGIQALLNMGVVMGLLPTKGLTLPFISYGGTSLIISLASMGILLNISSQARKG